MKRLPIYPLIAAAGLMLLVVLGIGKLMPDFGDLHIEESSGPTLREKAQPHCLIQLPPSARDVQYATLAGGLQDGQFFIRFEAPVADCHAAAMAVFAVWMKTEGIQDYPRFEQVNHPPPYRSSRLHTEWFDVENISNGSVAGSGSSWMPRIWIDEDRGIFYYTVTD